LLLFSYFGKNIYCMAAQDQPKHATHGDILVFKQGDTITAPLFNLKFDPSPANPLNTAPGTKVACDIKRADDKTLVCRFEWTVSSVAVIIDGTTTTYTRSEFYLKHVDEDGLANTDHAEIVFFMEEQESNDLPIVDEFTYEIKYEYPIGGGAIDMKTFIYGTGCIVPSGTDPVTPL